ncbi:tetratricopeptide repeat protein [Azorhizobium doebereinerae]|uniref:tetratricopeptide repeat protein n=1 Tax=Azorhizobium doebereinerae TaxID=281091 RepID=UPI000416D752|nr:tetratricopeptide repeat protein [Azorhizobium doebereinerae]
MREQVFASPNITIVRVPGAETGPAFVTFEAFDERPAPERVGFGEAFFARRGVEAYHVIPARNGWYQHPEMPEALAAVRARIGRDRPLVTYGSSMGGYAAYRFSGVLDAARVIAFSPQYTIDYRRIPWETRWRKVAAHLPPLWDALPVSRTAEAFLFYDPRCADRRHAGLIGREMRAHHIRLPHGGHPCMPLLQEAGLLAPAILDIAAGRFDPRLFAQRVRQGRTTSARYLSGRALALPRLAGRRRLALAAKAVALAPDEPWYRVAHGRLLAAHGAWAHAEARYREAMALLPDHPALLFAYRRFLMKAGRWAEAEAAAEQALNLLVDPPSREREINAIRAARRHAERPLLVRALWSLARRDALRGP